MGGLPGKGEGAIQFPPLDGVDEPNLVGEDAPVTSALDAQSPAALAVSSGIPLEADPGVDAEAKEQSLHPPDELLRDHVDFHDCGGPSGGYEAICLENALQVGRHHGERSR